MTRLFKSLFSVFFLSAFSFTAYAEADSVKTSACIPVRTLLEDNLPFKAGEYFKFTIHYTWGVINSDVGWAEARLDTLSLNGRKVFHCKAFGRTVLWYDWFFKVREDFQSWFTVDGLVPQRFTRDTHEGRYRARNNYHYVWDAAEPYIDADVYSSSSGQRYPDLPLDQCTYDLPALFYLARNMDFDVVQQGVRHPMTFAIDDEVFNVYFILLGREVRKIKGLGSVKTIKFAAKLLEGEVFKGEQDMLIWVTDDENRMPVCFEAPLLVGFAEGRLAEYSGLKYPFTALIEK